MSFRLATVDENAHSAFGVRELALLLTRVLVLPGIGGRIG
jgi:hypothetical protein